MPRTDSQTGEEILEGFLINNELYIGDEDRALKIVQAQGFKSLKQSYEAEFHYWTTWHDKDE